MKTILSLKITTILSLIIMSLTSCNKSDLTINEGTKHKYLNATIENGILNFKSSNDLKTSVDTIMSLTEQEIVERENKSGFISLRLKSEQALDEVSKSNQDTHTFHASILKNYQYVSVVDSSLEITVKGKLLASLANKDGVFIVEDSAIKVFSTYIVKTKACNISKLKDVKEGDAIPFGMIKSQYFNTEKLKSISLIDYQRTTTSGDRRMITRFFTSQYQVTGLNSVVEVYWRVTGQARNFGIWTNYANAIKGSNCNVTLQNNIGYIVNHKFPDFSVTNSNQYTAMWWFNSTTRNYVFTYLTCKVATNIIGPIIIEEY